MANRYDDDRENSEAVLKLNGGMVMPESSVQYVRQTDIDSIRYPELVIKLALIFVYSIFPESLYH